MKPTHSLMFVVCVMAITGGSTWAATLYDAAFRVRVTEEDGTPVTNAQVKASFPHLEDFSLKEPVWCKNSSARACRPALGEMEVERAESHPTFDGAAGIFATDIWPKAAVLQIAGRVPP